MINLIIISYSIIFYLYSLNIPTTMPFFSSSFSLIVKFSITSFHLYYVLHIFHHTSPISCLFQSLYSIISLCYCNLLYLLNILKFNYSYLLFICSFKSSDMPMLFFLKHFLVNYQSFIYI